MIPVYDTHRRATVALLLSLILASTPAIAGPIVVPTAEGQIGEMPGAGDKVLGPRVESIRGQPGEVLLGGLFIAGGAMPPPPEFQFLTDKIHGASNPAQVAATPDLFLEVGKTEPASSWSRNAAGDGDFVAFSFAVDGSMPDTMTVRIATFDETGSSLIQVPVAENVETFAPFPESTFSGTAVGVDDQGRVTVVFTAFTAGVPAVRGTRLEAATGTVIDPDFLVTDLVAGDPGAALLDPAGNRLIVATNELVNPPAIFGNIVDFTGGAPVVSPEFPIDSTAASFGNINPAVAADPATGNFTVVWEHLDDLPGNPVDVRARRFDADGNPIGDDFVVDSTTANAQGQQTVAYGLEGLSAIAWAGDAPTAGDELDVFLQVYDAMGNPIGGEVQVNTFTADVQDRPAVRFLPDRDAFGRPQIAVAWRDVGTADGASPRGTGTSYKCFSVNGFDEQLPIFEDGFESGDTSSWSDSQP